MNKVDEEYNKLVNLVLDKGRVKKNRTGINTLGVFGAQARFNLQEGFPLLTTKKVFMKAVIHELLWFLSGSTNIKYLVDNDVHIWDGNAYDRYLKSDFKNQFETGPETKEEYINALKTLGEDTPFVTNAGDLGEGTYGGMWRAFPHFEDLGLGTSDYCAQPVDQIQKVINSLKNDPDSRRHIVSAWHPYWVDHCALPPCHVLFQFHTEELSLQERAKVAAGSEDLIARGRTFFEGEEYVTWLGPEDDESVMAFFDKQGIPKRRINCQLYQRSCDLFLGVPLNIASYSLLTSMIAQVVNMLPGEFVHTYGDLHLYQNHLNQVKEQLSREPKNLPKLSLNKEVKNIFDFKYEDVKIEGYDPHPIIKAEMAV